MKMKTNELDMSRIPRHIAIIMDGNGRWATERNKPRSYGHQAGVDTVRRITSECTRLGVKYLTLYTLLDRELERARRGDSRPHGTRTHIARGRDFHEEQREVRVIGDIGRLPKEVQEKLHETEEHTRNNSKMTMVVALSYSARWEITEAARQIAEQVKSGELNADDITEDTVSQRLTTNFMPDPELLIRTGGELRISNYLLWQIAYSELYFCDTYWPDFSEEDLHKAIASYQSRQRRFGKTEEQVETSPNEGESK